MPQPAHPTSPHRITCRAFEKTGLGERVANMMVAAVGHSTLGLAYSLAFAESLMAPAMPSCTARAGGIFMPVIKFLALASGSSPKHGRKKMGAFLVHSQMQVGRAGRQPCGAAMGVPS